MSTSETSKTNEDEDIQNGGDLTSLEKLQQNCQEINLNKPEVENTKTEKLLNESLGNIENKLPEDKTTDQNSNEESDKKLTNGVDEATIDENKDNNTESEVVEDKKEVTEKEKEEVKTQFGKEVNERLLSDLSQQLTEGELEEVKNALEGLEQTNQEEEEAEIGLGGSGEPDSDMSTRTRHTPDRHTVTRPPSKTSMTRITGKLPAELRGQPSVKSATDEEKYWKTREQELLGKIADLEKRAGGTAGSPRYEGPIDPVALQRQEKLEKDLHARTQEKDTYKKRLQSIEKELLSKQKEFVSEPQIIKSGKSADDIINQLKAQNQDLRTALSKMTAILRDKTGLCASQEKKVAALNNQVESLKEVIAITKDLLNIRNMEVQHLTADISKMESKIDTERERHNQMIVKMDEAVKLNSELKKEYETQLKIFQRLREKYEEKVEMLSRENAKREQQTNLADLIRSVSSGLADAVNTTRASSASSKRSRSPSPANRPTTRM